MRVRTAPYAPVVPGENDVPADDQVQRGQPDLRLEARGAMHRRLTRERPESGLDGRRWRRH